MKTIQEDNNTMVIFLAEDGYTVYYKDFPYISAGGDTEEEALKELGVAFKLAQEE